MSTPGWAAGQKRFYLSPYSYAEAAEIARALEVPEPVAIALVRRGHRTVADARAFLAADEQHDPAEFDRVGEAVGVIRAAIEAGRLITVHGDYDVDGVTSTTILVRALRGLGADCDWLIPSRVEDGYGLTETTIEKLVARGTGLLITADCGITSVAEVAAAQASGIDVVVTDHHQPSEELPPCPIVHPVVSGYPCPDLCAAGVAHKLVAALVGTEEAERDLDLVALATIADMVPLTGENRSLVRRGLERIRRSPRIGLRALMATSKVTPERISESDISFRLSPRINAAGRLYRADAAVELFLTDDPERAAEIATELDRANLDRRETEREVLAEANALLAKREKDTEPAAAIVIWGEGWHPGVVGICASRVAERHGRPAILIALDPDGRGKGSGRSVSGFDLLGALRASGEHLARFGGHRAAAGLEIEAAELEGFRETFEAYCASILADGPLPAVENVDAVVGAEALGHELAAQMARLGPFGMANPEVRLVVPSASIGDVRPMGEEQRHARFSLRSGPARAGGVAFGVGGTLERAAEAGVHDATVKLELNEWNGAVEPRVVLGSLYDPPPAAPGEDWRCDDDEFTHRFTTALDGPIAFPHVDPPEARGKRELVDRRGSSGLAAIAELASTGEAVLVVCADALRRRATVERAASPARFGEGASAIVAARGSLLRGVGAAERVSVSGGGGIALADWAALSLEPGLPALFSHVVIADPAPHPDVHALAAAGGQAGACLHQIATDPELTLRTLSEALPIREELAAAYRALREAGPALEGVALRNALGGPSGSSRSPESAALALRVLAEIGVVRMSSSGGATLVEVVSLNRGDLTSSVSFRTLRKAHEECVRYLRRPEIPSSKSLRTAA